MKLGHVALDGTKMKANTCKHKAMSYGRMKKEAERLAKEIDAMIREAARFKTETRTSISPTPFYTPYLGLAARGFGHSTEHILRYGVFWGATSVLRDRVLRSTSTFTTTGGHTSL